MNKFFLLYVTILICFSIIGFPLLLIAFFRKSWQPLYAGILLFIAFSFDSIMVLIPRLFGFSLFHWNWEGKLIEFIWPFILVFVFKWLKPEEIGLNSPNLSGFLLGIGLGIFFSIISLAELYLFNYPAPINLFNAETLLFQFTLPGLAEELVYRGVFLFILNRYLGYQWKIFKAPFGWGAVLVTVLFLAIHVVKYVPNQNSIVLNFSLFNVDFIFFCCALVYLRERTGSIWPGVLCHNIANGLPVLVAWITY